MNNARKRHERTLAARLLSLGNAGTTHEGGDFEAIVVFTRAGTTLRALRMAKHLAGGLSAGIRLLVPHVVRYPIPLLGGVAGTAFLGRRFRSIAGDAMIEIRVDIRLCRNRWQMLQQVLSPKSVVVLGGNAGWWPTAEKRLARKLRGAGHQVLFAEAL